MIVQRNDGSLWMLVRTRVGIGESVSTDRGKTWSDVAPAALCQTASRFFIRRLKSGNLLLIKHSPPDHGAARSHLTACLSADDGKTWLGGFLLDECAGVTESTGSGVLVDKAGSPICRRVDGGVSSVRSQGKFDWDRFRRLPIVGILRGFTCEQAEQLALAATAGGLTAIEVAMNTPNTVQQISRLCGNRLYGGRVPCRDPGRGHFRRDPGGCARGACRRCGRRSPGVCRGDDTSLPSTGDITAFGLYVDSATNSVRLDSVAIVANQVPEPGTLALLAAGLLGFVAYAWRKRR